MYSKILFAIYETDDVAMWIILKRASWWWVGIGTYDIKDSSHIWIYTRGRSSWAHIMRWKKKILFNSVRESKFVTIDVSGACI